MVDTFLAYCRQIILLAFNIFFAAELICAIPFFSVFARAVPSSITCLQRLTSPSNLCSPVSTSLTALRPFCPAVPFTFLKYKTKGYNNTSSNFYIFKWYEAPYNMHFPFLLYNKPGQWSEWHFSFAVESPEHSDPPFCICLTLFRRFVFSMCLQVHLDQNVHSPHLQSTVELSID